MSIFHQRTNLVTCLFTAFVAGALGAETVYISPTGDDTNGKGTELEPYQTPAKGLSQCVDGDTLRLLDGTYNLTGTFTINKKVTVTGNPADRTAVVINVGSTAANPYHGIMLNNNSGCWVENLVVSNAYITAAAYGAGITSYSIGFVSNCVITCCTSYNASTSGGGGLSLRNGGEAHDCLFTKNYAYYRGGAVFLNDHESKVVDCTFEDNESYGGAGAVMGFDGQAIGCTFRHNRGAPGAFAFNEGFVSNCTFVGNATPRANMSGGAVSGKFSYGIVDSTFIGNGTLKSGHGSAVYLNWANSTSVISRCSFVSNTCWAMGMAICTYAKGVGVKIEDCVFKENMMTNTLAIDSDRGGWCSGGAVAFGGNYADQWCWIDRCSFIGNYGMAHGAVSLGYCGQTRPDSTIRNCYFYGNALDGRGPADGAAIALANNVYMTIENCTIVSNKTAGNKSPAIFYNGDTTDRVKVRNTVMANNYAAATKADILSTKTAIDAQYCVSETAIPGDATACHNRVMTMEAMAFTDAAQKNFMPKKGSPLVDTGLNETWMTGAADIRNLKKFPRIVNTTVDIGAWELKPKTGMVFILR